VWPFGAIGESPTTRIAILAPCHRLRRAGIKPLAVAINKVTAPVNVSIDQFWRGGRCIILAFVP